MTGHLTHRLGGQCRTSVGFPPSGSWPGVFERQLPPKLQVARMHGHRSVGSHGPPKELRDTRAPTFRAGNTPYGITRTI